MTATNHAITGALLGLTIHNPVLAISIAFFSHFVLDSIPHFGDDKNKLKLKLNGKRFQAILFSDIAGCILFAILLFYTQPSHWFLALVCAVVATSPDFAWFPDYLAALRKRPKPAHGIFRRFAARIQWSQTPEGAYLELLWALGIAVALYLKFNTV